MCCFIKSQISANNKQLYLIQEHHNITPSNRKGSSSSKSDRDGGDTTKPVQTAPISPHVETLNTRGNSNGSGTLASNMTASFTNVSSTVSSSPFAKEVVSLFSKIKERASDVAAAAGDAMD